MTTVVAEPGENLTGFESDADGLSASSGATEVTLPQSLKAAPVSITAGGPSVSLTLVGADRNATVERSRTGQTARYAGVLPGVTAEYQLESAGLKETLLLQNADSPTEFSYRFKYSEALQPALLDDGSVAIENEGGELQFVIPPPTAIDASGNAGSAQFRLSRGELELTVDEDWAASPSRTFPIAVDPSLSTVSSGDCSIVLEDLAPANCASGELYVGERQGLENRSMLKFDLSAAPQGYDLKSASLSAFQTAASGPKTAAPEVSAVQGAWSSNVSWSGSGYGDWDSPGGDTLAGSSTAPSAMPSAATGYLRWPISDIVEDWLETPSANHGVRLTLEQTQGTALRTLASSETVRADRRPMLLLVWGPKRQTTGNVGLEFGFDEGSGSFAHSSSSYHDALISGAQWTSAGKYGSALDFDGIDDLASVASSNDIEFGDEFSLMAWVKPDSTGLWGSVVTKETPNFMAYQLYARGLAAGPAGYVADGDWSYSGVNGPAALPVNQWSHIAVTSDGARLRFYLAGERVASGPARSAQAGAGSLQIGGNDIFDEYFDGKIDEVRVYDRALPEDWIASHVTTAIGSAKAPRPVAAYGFEEGVGTTSDDSIGRHDGALYGASWSSAGRFGKSLSFDGVNDRFAIPDHDALDLTDKLTLEAWVRPTASNSWGSVISKATSTDFITYQLYSHGSGPAKVPAGYLAQADWDYKGVNGSTGLPLNTWSHLALTSNGKLMKLYVDGDLVATAQGYVAQEGEGPLEIGGNEVFTEYFAGQIDEVRIYDQPLARDEINADLARPIIESPTFEEAAAVPSRASVGVPIRAEWGRLSGNGPFQRSYQWERCATATGSCQNITSATTLDYTPSASDSAKYLRLRVTATNAAGSATSTSARTGAVSNYQPRFLSPAKISGTPSVGSSLTVTTPDLVGTGPIASTYQWEACDEACTPLAGSGSSLLLTGAEVGARIRVIVSASNSVGDAESVSKLTAAVAPAQATTTPVAVARPVVTGVPRVTATVTSTLGTWVSTPTAAKTIRWQRCSDATDPQSCTDISGAQGPSYELTASDVDAYIRSVVTADTGTTQTQRASRIGPVIEPEENTMVVFETPQDALVLLAQLEETDLRINSMALGGDKSRMLDSRDMSPDEIREMLLEMFPTQADDLTVEQISFRGGVSLSELGDLGEQVLDLVHVPSIRAWDDDPPSDAELSFQAESRDPGSRFGWPLPYMLADSPEELTDADELIEFARIEGEEYPAARNALVNQGVQTPAGVPAVISTDFVWSTTRPSTGASSGLFLNLAPVKEPVVEMDVKLMNGNNEPGEYTDFGEFNCNPWEEYAFWAKRDDVVLNSNLPDEADLRFDNASLEPCRFEDLSYSIFQPSALEDQQSYRVEEYLPNRGVAANSQLVWSISIEENNCGSVFLNDPVCVGIGSRAGPTNIMIDERYRFSPTYPVVANFDAIADDEFYGDDGVPATLPGCYTWYDNNATYTGPYPKGPAECVNIN